jgi:transposase
MAMRRHEIEDGDWAKIENLLPGKKGDAGRTAEDNRLFINAVLWLARTGAGWRDLPERLGKWNSVFVRFNRWNKRGVWLRVLKAWQCPDLQELMLDSTVIRAHQHAGGASDEKKVKRRSAGRAAASARKSTSRSTRKAALSNCV